MSEWASWGRVHQAAPARVISLVDRAAALPDGAGRSLLAYGRGRSYGDVCLNRDGVILHTRGLDRWIRFDRQSGVLSCEAGVTLREILQLVVPQGWFLSVTPGTREVTVGGAIANDVHGKNHHAAGTFAHHLRGFELLRSDGARLDCTPARHPDWFAATVGGLGLTGLVTRAELQLAPVANAYLDVQTLRFHDLDEFWELNAEAERLWPYTVAWLDCAARGASQGRGVFSCARHAPSQPDLPLFRERRRTMPFTPPFSLVNPLSLRAFNGLYWHKARTRRALSHYVPYFYPLDAIAHWNRLYGRAGFYQYQCVVPPSTMREAIAELLARIAASGQGSFLAVLKTFGSKPSLGLLSFARTGATLALDFPNRGAVTQHLFQDLDVIVRSAGGALYPAKDARMPPDLFRQAYPRLQDFTSFVDPAFGSDFWRRMCA
ncbi:MAG: FAD-binding oxidoreductase [Betaproteobacteria bacterium]|nr:FAD-binding oxidoreductase [Betaproteobacteria bacterium]